MLSFIIPVKSRAVSQDWERFSKLFQRTLHSVLNQSNPNFEVIVVGHELPNITTYKDQIRFIPVHFEVPLLGEDWETNRHKKEEDKAKKIMVGYEQVTDACTHIMVVDADDGIHKDLAKFVQNNLESKAIGWYFTKGFYYREGSRFIFKNIKTFHALCGSCLIIKRAVFPKLIERRPWLYYHHETIEIEGIPLEPFPFEGAIYSMVNGENHFMSSGHAKHLINKPSSSKRLLVKSLRDKMKKYRPQLVGSQLKKSFNFYPIP